MSAGSPPRGVWFYAGSLDRTVHDDYAHPYAGWAVLAGMVGWTAVTQDQPLVISVRDDGAAMPADRLAYLPEDEPGPQTH